MVIMSLSSSSLTSEKNGKKKESLSDFTPKHGSFYQIENIIASFRNDDFRALSFWNRFKKINQVLCQLIQDAPHNSFLLPHVVDFFSRVNQEKILHTHLNFAMFEFWLNAFSNLSYDENYLVRAKIVGRYIPRSSYQSYFPIGMHKIFSGTHFVTAHLSPDVDTMIASFWGWIDAFAARVGTGMHLWCLPGGPPDSPVTTLVKEIFSDGTFSIVARTPSTLTLSAMDLVNYQKLTKEKGSKLVAEIDHGANENAIILVNDQGNYLGEWRTSDVELVLPVTIAFKACLRWFENNFHTKLISLFAKPDLKVSDFPALNAALFEVQIKDCGPAKEFSKKQNEHLNDLFIKIFAMNKGLASTFGELIESLKKQGISEPMLFMKEVEDLSRSEIFDSRGNLLEDRPKIFKHLDQIIKELDTAIYHIHNFVERLDVVLNIKHKVLNYPFLYVTLRSDVEEMKQKMQNYDFLTVVVSEEDGSLYPVGVVNAADLRKSSLGTVSFRDFCNQEEVKMASYLEVISVIDHHKSSLKTTSVPSAIIGDAQSCNILIAEETLAINDEFGTDGMSLEAIQAQMKELEASSLSTPSHIRIYQKLLKKFLTAKVSHPFFVNPERQFVEYLTCLHAILDDTDLLTKVSVRDVECVMQLLNGLKSLSLGKEVEIINFDDIPKDKNFAKTAAQRILRHPDMYSLYKKVYDYREIDVEDNLKLCTAGKNSSLFIDTKEQNGCARVGQTKIFTSNFPTFLAHANNIRSTWLKEAGEFYKEKPEVDLYIHMVSTIASSEEVYKNQIGPYDHLDELWIWIPPTQQAKDHLISFLAGFQQAVKELKDANMCVEFLGPNASIYQGIFLHNFLPIPLKTDKGNDQGMPIAILRFKAGSLNSRKSMITPFIPRLIP